MREILFRGKRVEDLKWAEGFYFREAGHFIKELPSAVSMPTHIVYPETIGQYTGLKDKNGKRIFEGDILEGQGYDEEDGYAVVTWDDGAFWVGNKHVCGTFCENYYGHSFEVIGNIHDNPELLEEAWETQKL